MCPCAVCVAVAFDSHVEFGIPQTVSIRLALAGEETDNVDQ